MNDEETKAVKSTPLDPFVITVVRQGARLHPMPVEGETMDGREFRTAEAYGLALMLADEVVRLTHLLAEMRCCCGSN